MSHVCKDTTSPTVAMVDMKCSPLSSSPDRGCHLPSHLECLQHWLQTIQSIGRHRPALLHMDNFPAHLGDLPLASPRNNLSRQQNRAGQMWQGLLICPHYQRFLVTNLMQMVRAMIRRTWAGLKAKPQLAWSKWNFHWSNLPKGWGSPTLVPSTSGRKYGWLGFLRRSISPLSRDRTVGNRCEMDPCAGRWRLQIFWTLSTPSFLWKTSIMLNGFGNNVWRCSWGNLQVRFGRWGKWEGEATSKPATDLGERAGNKARGNVPELPNKTCRVVIRRVPNSNNDRTSTVQFQASYTDVRHWEELIDFIETNCSPKEPSCLTGLYKSNLTQEELDEEDMGLYAPG